MGTRRRIHKILLIIALVLYAIFFTQLNKNEFLFGYLCAIDFGVISLLMVTLYITGLPHDGDKNITD